MVSQGLEANVNVVVREGGGANLRAIENRRIVRMAVAFDSERSQVSVLQVLCVLVAAVALLLRASACVMIKGVDRAAERLLVSLQPCLIQRTR